MIHVAHSKFWDKGFGGVVSGNVYEYLSLPFYYIRKDYTVPLLDLN